MTDKKPVLSKKQNYGRFFEDFIVGETIIHATPRTITQGDIALYFALTGSRFAIYSSEPFAQSLGFRQCPVDNLLVFHFAFGKTVNDISLNAVANLGYAETRFLCPTFVGDTLSVSSKVIGKKENSNGKTGIVYVHSTATNQNNEDVVSWKRWVMIKKHHNHQAPPPLIPSLDKAILPNDLAVPDTLDMRQIRFEWSGSSDTANDFEPGEVLLHRDGMTINASDHSLATRLYQNNARVHFDRYHQQQLGQEPLVYGGHIMSVCRSLSFAGLANGMWLAAINGGSHTAPSYAGDTISSATKIVDKGIINKNKNIAWLRIETFGFKNASEHAVKSFMLKEKSDAEQVLFWDYTVLLPAQ